MKDEHRRNPRLKPGEPVPAKVPIYVTGEILDLSESGLLMRVRRHLAPGSFHTMRLVFADGEVEVSGRVRRCELAGFDTDEEGDRVRSYKAALEFARPAPELVGRLRPGEGPQVRLEQNNEG